MTPGSTAETVVDPGLAFDDSGSGEPLVLVHGLATTRAIWRRVLRFVRDGRRVIAVDVPGFGRSPPAGPGFSLDAVAARIAAGLERAEVVPPYDLVGHSMGGAVTLALAARDPDAVRRLVLVAPAGLRPMPAPAARVFGATAVRTIAFRRRGAGLADLGWGRRLLTTPNIAHPSDLPPAEVRAMLVASRGATRIAEALSTVASADLRPLLRALPVPVGAVWGERDRIIPPGGLDTVLSLRPGAPAATVGGAGHIPMIERPGAFAAALEEVLHALLPPNATH